MQEDHEACICPGLSYALTNLSLLTCTSGTNVNLYWLITFTHAKTRANLLVQTSNKLQGANEIALTNEEKYAIAIVPYTKYTAALSIHRANVAHINATSKITCDKPDDRTTFSIIPSFYLRSQKATFYCHKLPWQLCQRNNNSAK